MTPESRVSTLIVGAGAAGARVAQGLSQAGQPVTVLEAANRVGGRLHTVRAPGVTYEAGGEWIDADHHRVLGSLRALGQEPIGVDQSRQVVEFEGQVALTESGGFPREWVDTVLDAQLVDEARDFLSLDLELPPWHNVLSLDLDDQTLGAWLDRTCQTRRGRWIHEARFRSDEGEDSHRIGLLGWLIGQMGGDERPEGAMSAYRFPEGAQRWVERLLDHPAIDVRLSERVHTLAREGERFRVDTDRKSYLADRVVLTASPRALLHLTFDPDVSEAKRAAWEALPLSRTLKVALRFRSAPWREDTVAPGVASVLTDRPSQQWWAAQPADGSDPVLLAYVAGEDADRLRAQPDPVESVLRDIQARWPNARAALVEGTLHDWIADPLTGGGFSCLPPGFVLAHWEDLLQPEAGLHFAGEACAIRNGFIEGALESAERVLGELGVSF